MFTMHEWMDVIWWLLLLLLCFGRWGIISIPLGRRLEMGFLQTCNERLQYL